MMLMADMFRNKGSDKKNQGLFLTEATGEVKSHKYRCFSHSFVRLIFFQPETGNCHFFDLSLSPKLIGGALNKQAEIKPIEPVRVMPERENEKSVQFKNPLVNFCGKIREY